MSSRPHSRSSSSSSSSAPHRHRDQAKDSAKERFREKLKNTCQETISILPTLLNKLQRSDDAREYQKCTLINLPRLNPNNCPSYDTPATIKVINEDTFKAAIDMAQRTRLINDPRLKNPYPAVVNFANRHTPGGGWLRGAIAQEEALCYRSSLSLSLNPKEYPLGTNDALYSPYVVIIRSALGDGHKLLHHTVPVQDLPTVSVLTVAAIHQPETQSFTVQSRANNSNTPAPTGGLLPPIKRIFAHNRERNLTKDKMRLVLRMAASHGHSALVLGALGCGAFANPPEDVAHCWLEVLREDEFSGNWWREVYFAVYDPKDEGNYDIFRAVLEGKEV